MIINSLDQHFLMFVVFVCAQILLYEVGVKQALQNYWFLGLFYFLVFSCVQGLVIFARYCSIPLFPIPAVFLLALVLLQNGLKRAPQFQKKSPALADFYLFSSLGLGLIWAVDLSDQAVFVASYHFMEAFVWSWFCAVLLPVLAGIRERIEFMETPPNIPTTAIFLSAAAILVLVFSFF